MANENASNIELITVGRSEPNTGNATPNGAVGNVSEITAKSKGTIRYYYHSPAGELEMQKNLSIVFKGAMRMP